MRWYEENVDIVLGVVPDYEYSSFGIDAEWMPKSSTRGLAKSVLMPGHLIGDIYEGDEEAIVYAVQLSYLGTGALYAQYAITGTVSERALYGATQGAKRLPTTIFLFEVGYISSDMSKRDPLHNPKSISGRALRHSVGWGVGKIFPGLNEWKFMEPAS